jgi:hypothetical protein
MSTAGEIEMKLVHMNRLAMLLAISLSSPVLADRVIEIDKTATVDCGKDPDVAINHGNGDYTFKGTCNKIHLQGGGNKLTIENVKTLTIIGADNTATIDGVDKISVTGAKNTVTYKKTVAAKKTAVAAIGANNKITQSKQGPSFLDRAPSAIHVVAASISACDALA